MHKVLAKMFQLRVHVFLGLNSCEHAENPRASFVHGLFELPLHCALEGQARVRGLCQVRKAVAGGRGAVAVDLVAEEVELTAGGSSLWQLCGELSRGFPVFKFL